MARVEERAPATFKKTVDIQGALTRMTPEILFRWNYIDCGAPLLSHAQSSDTATADGHVAPMLWPGTNGELYHTNICRIGATTSALETPVMEGTIPATDTASTAAGLNMQMDQDTAADLGWELTIGGPLGDGRAFTVGTHSGYIDLSVFVADWTEYDAISIGFRKVEPYQTGHAPIIGAGTGDPVYTDFATFGLQEPDKIQIATDLNGGGSGTYTDTGMTPTDSRNQRFRVTLAESGAVTYTLEQDGVANGGTMAAPSTTAAFTFDSGDKVIPYVFVHGATHVDEALLIKHLEVKRTPGTSYVN